MHFATAVVWLCHHANYTNSKQECQIVFPFVRQLWTRPGLSFKIGSRNTLRSARHHSETSSMIEFTLGIMAYFEWCFFLSSASKYPDFFTSLHHNPEARGRRGNPQTQFEFSCLLRLLCLQYQTGQVSTRGQSSRIFGSGPQRRHPGPGMSCLLPGYFLIVRSVLSSSSFRC